MSGTLKPVEQWLDPDRGAAYRRLDLDGVRLRTEGRLQLLCIEPPVLRSLTQQAFHDMAFYLEPEHLGQWAAILDDPQATEGERLVITALLKNAVLAAEGVFPMCQDTGTATVFGFKGQEVFTGGDDAHELGLGIRAAWSTLALRASQVAPLSMFEECNTNDNLPAWIDVRAVPGAEYRFLFVAKGGGSANKSCLVQASKAVLNEAALQRLLEERIAAMGVAACPPYHLGVVIGGFSAEYSLTLLKWATTGYLDSLPRQGAPDGRPYRDLEWEQRVMDIARASRLGAQFGGRHLAASARVIRLPRHAGSCPIAIGISCSAHRNVRAKITTGGVFLGQLEREPARFLKQRAWPGDALIPVDLEQPMEAIRETLGRLPQGALVRLNGPLVLARDSAHARFSERLHAGEGLPEYLKRHPVYYAGPADAPPGKMIGSLGPTTSQRMDVYVPELMAQGASLVMVGKGPRAAEVARACRDYRGAYLAAIGGPAALLGAEHVSAAEVIDFPDLGMEAVRRIHVRDMPALLVLGGREQE